MLNGRTLNAEIIGQMKSRHMETFVNTSTYLCPAVLLPAPGQRRQLVKLSLAELGAKVAGPQHRHESTLPVLIQATSSLETVRCRDPRRLPSSSTSPSPLRGCRMQASAELAVVSCD